MIGRKVLTGFICVILFFLFIVMMITSVSDIKLSVSSETVKTLPDLIVDAGHGGEDGGAVSDNGVLEKDINLLIANDTADLLYLFGFDVTKTRSDDTALSTNGDTVRSRKVDDMKNRLEIFNSSDNNVVISIHQNKFTESEYYGTQIFYSPNNEKSKILAENIKFSVKSLLQPENERECKKADSGIYLLNNTDKPAVIVECGFISNNEELQKLLTDSYQKQMSYSIVTGFLDYYNTN